MSNPLIVFGTATNDGGGDTLNAAFLKVNTAISSLNADEVTLSSLASTVNNPTTGLAATNAIVASPTQGNAALLSDINAQQTSITTINGQITTANSNIASLQVLTANQGTTITTQGGQISALQTAVSGLGASGELVYASVQTGIHPNSATDSFTGLANAVASVAGKNASLVIDCAITVTQGTDWTKTIFIPSGVNIYIGPGGSITHDGIGVPLFVFSDAVNSSITGTGRITYNAAFGTVAYTYNTGQILTFGAISNAGTGYTPGTYNWVKMTPVTGSGIDAFCQVVVGAGGTVTSCALMAGGIWGGSGYAVGNSLTANAAFIGGTGSGFAIPVATINSTPNAFNTAMNNSINSTIHNYRTSIYSAGVSGNQFTGGAQPFYTGITNSIATIILRGACKRVRVDGFTMDVPDGAPACNFRPCGIALQKDWSPGLIISGSSSILTVNTIVGGSAYVNGVYNAVPGVGGSGTQATFQVTVAGGVVTTVVPQITGSGYVVGDTITFNSANLGGAGSGASCKVATIGTTPLTAFNMSAPDQTYANITIDGFLMGMVGGSQNFEFGPSSTFKSYSDLQNSAANDPNGLQIGGVGYYSAPPHAAYLDNDTDPTAFQYSYSGEITDLGIYVGTPTRRSSSSGHITSWKGPIQFGGSLKRFTCLRPDGAMQLTAFGNPNGEFLNIFATFDSTVQMLTKPGDTASGNSGIIFPSSAAFNTVKVQGTFIDTAPVPAAYPMGSDNTSAHTSATIDIGCVTQDFPQTPYSAPANASGIVVTSLYGPTNGTGFAFAGLGNKVTHPVQFKNFTNTSKTNIGILTGGGTVNGSEFNVTIIGWRNVPGPNYDGLGVRLQIAGTGAANNNNFVFQRDVTNNNERTVRGAVMTERWTQDWTGTPAAGATYDTPLQFASTYSIVLPPVAENGSTPPAGPTSYQVGDSALATRFITSVSTTGSGNNYYPTIAPIALVNNPTIVRLTSVGGNFTGTGTTYIALVGERTKVSE